MRIETTITVMKDGVCILETDVIACIDAHLDRYGDLEWHVDEYRVEHTQRTYDKKTNSMVEREVSAKVPDALADVFDDYLNREWMEEKIREKFADYGDDRADYLRDQMMDR